MDKAYPLGMEFLYAPLGPLGMACHRVNPLDLVCHQDSRDMACPPVHPDPLCLLLHLVPEVSPDLECPPVHRDSPPDHHQVVGGAATITYLQNLTGGNWTHPRCPPDQWVPQGSSPDPQHLADLLMNCIGMVGGPLENLMNPPDLIGLQGLEYRKDRTLLCEDHFHIHPK